MFRWTASDAGPVTGIDAVPFRDVVERARHYHAAYLEASRPLHAQAWSLVGEKEGNWWKAVTTLPGGATFGYACQNNSGTIHHTFQVDLPVVSGPRGPIEIWQDPDLTNYDALEAAPIVIDGRECALAEDQYYISPDDKDRKFVLALDSMQANTCVELLSRARAVAVPLLHGTRSGSRALLQVSLVGGAQTIATAASRCAQGTAVETHHPTARSPAPATNRK